MKSEVYHWSDLWRSLLSFVRFLTSYATSLRSISQLDILLDDVINLIALALHTGDAFLPSPGDYDDLFYKVVETGDVLIKFRDVCKLCSLSSLPPTRPSSLALFSFFVCLFDRTFYSLTG